MKEMGELLRSERQTRVMYNLVAWISGLTIITVIVYGLASTFYSTGGIVEIGATLVNVEFPFPFFAKPVSYLSVACVTFFYSSLVLWKNKIAKWSRLNLSVLQLFAIVIAFASAYEVVFNFMLWEAMYTVQLMQHYINNPDIVTSPSAVPWNLVFATKMFASLFVISGYSVYFLRRIHHTKDAFPEV
jgi:hypothetical protein